MAHRDWEWVQLVSGYCLLSFQKGIYNIINVTVSLAHKCQKHPFRKHHPAICPFGRTILGYFIHSFSNSNYNFVPLQIFSKSYVVQSWGLYIFGCLINWSKTVYNLEHKNMLWNCLAWSLYIGATKGCTKPMLVLWLTWMPFTWGSGYTFCLVSHIKDLSTPCPLAYFQLSLILWSFWSWQSNETTKWIQCNDFQECSIRTLVWILWFRCWQGMLCFSRNWII